MNKLPDFQEIPFSQAIEAPLRACNRAQIQVARDGYSNLLDNLMCDTGGKVYEPVCVSFYFVQEDVVQRLKIPLMNLVSIPTMLIKDLHIHYQAQVTASSSTELKVRACDDTASGSESKQLHSFINIRLHAGAADMPMGLAKLYQLFGDTLTTVETSPVTLDAQRRK